MAEFFNMATWQVPFPNWTSMAYQIFFFFVFEDAFHFFGTSTSLAFYSRAMF
jgi:methylsterol monooxygenase